MNAKHATGMAAIVLVCLAAFCMPVYVAYVIHMFTGWTRGIAYALAGVYLIALILAVWAVWAGAKNGDRNQ